MYKYIHTYIYTHARTHTHAHTHTHTHRCRNVKNLDTYDGQATGMNCWDGRSDVEVIVCAGAWAVQRKCCV